MRSGCLLLLAACGIAIGCGGSEPEMPPNAIAKVGGTVITKEAFKRRLAAFFAGTRDRTQARIETVEFLVQSVWVEKEARVRHVVVPSTAVLAAFERHKQESFPTAGAYERFLAERGRTQTDILQVVRAHLLQRALTEQVLRLAPGTAEGRVRVLDDFARKLREKYRPRTVCAEGYRVSSCSNAPHQGALVATSGQHG
jgi:hypothetical protein